MPTTISAMRGHFGTTEYYLTTMNVGELLHNVRFPQELPDWQDLTIEELYQREINLARIRTEIAPYFANDPNRFSGALVLGVINNEQMVFEPLGTIGGTGRSVVPQLYNSAASNVGFLTLQGGEVLVPLDGQHRAKAFKFALEGVDERNRPIAGTANTDLAMDQVPVILVRFDGVKARYIFNKLNRYAKPTVKGDNLITDDDDAVAVLTRDLLKDRLIPARLVRLRGNTLTGSAHEFTTLNTFYESTTALLGGLRVQGYGRLSQMDEGQRRAVQPAVRERWEQLLHGMDMWREALADPEEGGDQTRVAIREQTILGKPVGQEALVKAFVMLRDRCEGVPERELVQRLNEIKWGVTEPQWVNVVLHSTGRVIAGRRTERASNFIAYLAGAPLTDDERARLLQDIHGDDWEQHELPNTVLDG